jgi:hypothetical protein
MLLIAAFAMAACGGGGGGGGEVAPPPPPPGGSGTGADGVPIFWFPYGTNSAFGAANAVQATSDGGIIAAGFEADQATSTRQEVHVLKVDGHGTVSWERRIALGTTAQAQAVRQTADGGYIIVGTMTVATGNTDIFALKLDAAGSTAAGWPKMFGGAGADEGRDVLAINGGADGYVIVGQRDVSQADSVNVYVLRLNADGSQRWERSDYANFCPGGGETARAIATAGDGNYAVAGVTGCFGASGILLKIDAANGNELWRHAYDTSLSNTALFESVAVAPDGGFVLAGSIAAVSGNPPVAGKFDALVVKTDANGNETWRRIYGGSEDEQAMSVIVAADNNFLVAGYSRSYGGAIQDPNQPFQWEDVMLVKLTSAGDTLWQKVKGNRPRASDRASAIARAADSSFIIGGSSGGNVMVARFDKNGDTVNLGSTDLTFTVPSTTGIIGLGNAIDVTAVSLTGMLDPRELGAGALDLLIDASKGLPVSDYCSGGGSYAFVPPVPATPTVGSSFAVTFSNCVSGPSGDLTQIDGAATMSIDALTGSLASGNYQIQTTLTAVDLTTADVGSAQSRHITGGMRYARSASGGAVAELTSSITTPVAQTITYAESGGQVNRTVAVGPFSIQSALSASGAFSIGTTTDTLAVTAYGATFAVVFLQPVQATSGLAPPSAGAFRITATDNSRVTATIASGTASLAVDTNGDGAVDGTLSAPWDFLH